MPFIIQEVTLTPISPQAQGVNNPLLADAPLGIRDTNTHYSAVLATNGAKRITFIAVSALNQVITFQVFGSKDSAVGVILNALDPSGPLVNGYTVTGGTNQPANPAVPASPSPSSVILGTLTDYHPFIQLSIVATVAPTAGVLSIFALMEVGET